MSGHRRQPHDKTGPGKDSQARSGEVAKGGCESATDPLQNRSLREIADDDLDEALSLVPKPDVQAYNALKDLAKYFAATDPEKAMRCARGGVAPGTEPRPAGPTLHLAEMGALVARLGNKEAGEQLAHEAADMTAHWATDRPEPLGLEFPRPPWPRATWIGALPS